MDIFEKAKKLKSLGDEYENFLNSLLNDLFKLMPDCLALNLDDSLLPIYAVSGLKTKGLLAFPYKCRGRVGYVVIGEDGILYFEDTEGNVIELK